MKVSNGIQFLEKMEPGVLVFDGNMIVTAANKIFLRQFPLVTENDIIGQDILALHHAESIKSIQSYIDRLDNGRHQIVTQMKSATMAGLDKYYMLRLMNLLAGKKTKSYCLLSYDITDYITNQNKKLIKMPAYCGDDIFLIDLKKILYFVADNVYTKFYTLDKEYYAYLMISEIEDKLPPGRFYRIHRSHIINLDHIEKVSKKRGGYTVNLKDMDQYLPVSRSKVKPFLELIGLK